MKKEQLITSLAANSTECTDFYKHISEGDYPARMAKLTARVIKGEVMLQTFWLLCRDELEIEVEVYVDELESGRRWL